MSRRILKTEGGDEVLLPTQKKKLCACGQPATRYCDFPKYGLRSGTFDRETGQITTAVQDKVVLCAEMLCDRCAVQKPNDKDFCRRHDDLIQKMIEDAETIDQE